MTSGHLGNYTSLTDVTLAHLNHIVALERWNLDYALGMCLQVMIDKGIASNYGAEQTLFLADTPFGKNGSMSKMYVLANSADFLIKRARHETLEIRSKRDQKMRDFAPFAKRQNQTAKYG